MLGYFSNEPKSNSPLFPELTDREREVLGLLGRGLHNPEIGRKLGIRPKTVRNHVSNVLTKFPPFESASDVRSPAALYPLVKVIYLFSLAPRAPGIL